jgi:hypothetical protein
MMRGGRGCIGWANLLHQSAIATARDEPRAGSLSFTSGKLDEQIAANMIGS